LACGGEGHAVVRTAQECSFGWLARTPRRATAVDRPARSPAPARRRHIPERGAAVRGGRSVPGLRSPANIAAFWGVRLSLQTILDAKPFLTTWWLVAGYHLLTVLFTLLTLFSAWAAVHPAAT